MIRTANISDLAAVVEIYNQAIDAGFQTAYTHKFRPEEKEGWFHEFIPGRYPLFVYEKEGRVAGWLSISAYRKGRQALAGAVEISYFTDQNCRKQGIGSALLQHGIDACTELGYHTLLAIILEPNIASARLLEKFGFERWGYLPDIADFNGTKCSQVYYGLKLLQ
jgi:phosphinothricin acetyltransferase